MHEYPKAVARNIEKTSSDATIGGRLLTLQQGVILAHELAGAAERIADQIAGSNASKADGGKPSPVPNGLYDELGVLIENLDAALSRIDLAIGRAGNRLG